MPSELMKVASVPPVTCPESAPLSQAARTMSEHGIGCVVVIDDERTVTGILTDRDIAVRAVGREMAPDTKVSEVMTREGASVATHASTLDAVRQMATRQCRRLPVVDEQGAVLGVVSLDDIYKAEGAVISEMNDVIGNQWTDIRQRMRY